MTKLWSIGNGRLVAKDALIEDGLVVIDGTVIQYAGPRRDAPGAWADEAPDVDAAGGYICPGFVDVHVHGGGGADVMDGELEALATMARSHVRHGTTALLATTMTAPLADLLPVVRTVGRAAADGPDGMGARILGLHLEGPYINPERAGAQNPRHMRPPTVDELARLHEAASGAWRRVTLAPELPGAMEAIDWLTGRGVRVSLGHSAAGLDVAAAAFAAGADSVTHTFNGMNPLHHREPGLLGATLTDEGVWAEVIADGLHVHDVVLRLLYKAKGPDCIVLVTDSMRAQGCGDGRYVLGDLPVVVQDGEARLVSDDPTEPGPLAGSVLTMDAAVRTMVHRVGASVPEAVRMASLNAAAAAGVQERKGSLAKGKDADVAVLDEGLHVRMTVVEGRVAYKEGDAPAPGVGP